jgi:hypothetical protein
VLDVPVSKVRLKCASVMPSIGQSVTAGVSQHVRMHLEAEFGLDPRALDHAREAWPQSQTRFADHIPNATSALSRARPHAGTWILLRVRAARLSLWLAR